MDTATRFHRKKAWHRVACNSRDKKTLYLAAVCWIIGLSVIISNRYLGSSGGSSPNAQQLANTHNRETHDVPSIPHLCWHEERAADKEWIKLPFPAYYINMNRSVERRRVTERLFRPLVADLRRVPAVDAENESALTSVMGNDTRFYRKHVSQVHGAMTPQPNKISSAEFGVILSHLLAIRTAYNDGCEAALIMEDDVSTVLTPFWTSTPWDALREAQTLTTNWTIIQVRRSGEHAFRHRHF